MMMRIGVIAAVLIAVAGPTAQAADNPASWRNRASADVQEVLTDDITEEVRFGREVAARIIGRYGLYLNDDVTRYVTLVGQSLARNANRPELAFRFAVLNTSDINGYACPGGYIFVTRGALEKMQDEAELAGVLAHEMIHVNERHVVKELNIRATEDSPASGLARLIGGSTDAARAAFFQSVDKAVETLFSTGYKREDENSADRGSVSLAAVAGYDPAGLVRYFERIAAAKGRTTDVLDRTHPAYAARIALLKETITRDGIESSAYRTGRERFAEAMKKMR
jgi:predicted Zn-dependent protease